MANTDPYALRTLVEIFFGIELVCGTATNCLILTVFYRKPALLNIANRFIVNLTIINIIACFSLLPLFIADNTSSLSSEKTLLCSLSDFFSHFTASVIPYSVLLIAIDQYFAVVDPLHYHSVITNVRSVWMIASAWVLPFCLSALGFVQSLVHGHKQSVFKVCAVVDKGGNSTSSEEDISSSSTWVPLIFSLTFVAASFVVPFFLICFIYSRICAAASGNNKRTKPDMGRLPEKGSSISCTDSSRVTEQEEVDWDEEDGGLQMNATPAVKVTRPSPPRADAYEIHDSAALPRTFKSATDLSPTLVIVKQTNRIKNNVSLPNLKVSRTDIEPNLLKPFLPRNTSFCLPSPPQVVPQRRHSNVPIPKFDGDILPKPRSLSKHSSFTNSSRSSSSRLPVSRASSIRSTSSYLVSNLRYRLSNAGLFRYRERARAARVSALVVVMALLCWLPFFSVYLLHTSTALLGVPELFLPQFVNAGAVALLLISTIASPALFAFRNRKIRKEIRRIFKLPVNDFRTCPGSFSRRDFLLRVKKQAIELISKWKPMVYQKPMTTAVPTNPL